MDPGQPVRPRVGGARTRDRIARSASVSGYDQGMSTRSRYAPRASIVGPLCALAAAAACGPADEPAPRHNVLLVTLDTTRADRMGCYGGTAATPNLDRLAEQGALFARAVSTAGLTPMSHASILTGLNNYRHGLRVFYSEEVSYTLHEENETLPEILAARGWKTGAFVSAYPVSEFYGLDQGFETYRTGVSAEELDLSRQQRHDELWNEEGLSSTQRRGDYTVDEALAWLEGVGEAPWCLWVHLFDVHDFSVVPPSDWIARFGIEYDKDVPVNSLEWRERIYDPEITFADEQVGRLFDRIEALGQWDDTVIVVTADHGQGLTDGMRNHGWLKHRLLYDWSLHVPMILRVPGEEAGVRVEPLVRTIDVLPTVLEALDVAGPDMEGQSMLALARGGPDDGRVAYADALNLFDQHAPKKMQPEYLDNLYCVTDASWKLIWHELAPENVELFDLRADPEELTNVAAANPDQVARLKAFLDERGATKMRAPGAGAAAPSTDALRNLGYIEDGDDEPEPASDVSGDDSGH